MKKSCLVIILFLLFVAIVNAKVEVSHTDLANKIQPGETAIFILTITNNVNRDNVFVIEKDQLQEYPFSDAIKEIRIIPAQVDVPALSEATARIEVKVLKDAIPNKNYETSLKIRSLLTGDKIKHPLLVSVIEPADLIRIDTDLPSKLRPDEELTFKINFKNTANLILDNVNLYVTSEFLEEKYKEKFYPFQEIDKTLILKLDPITKPGFYTLGVRAYYSNDLKGKLVKDFEIISTQDVEEKSSIVSGFLTQTKKLIKINQGNSVVEEQITITVSLFQKLFTRFDKEPSKKIGSTFEWDFKLNPNESYSLTMKTDYRLFFIIILILAIILGIWVYKITRGIIVRKSIIKIRDARGALVGLKIMLRIKNKTNYPLKNIKLIETLPINLTSEFAVLKPDKIQKGERSMRIIWLIDALETGEERLISYNAKSDMPITGRFVLSPLIMRFKGRKGIGTAYSNKIVLYPNF